MILLTNLISGKKNCTHCSYATILSSSQDATSSHRTDHDQSTFQRAAPKLPCLHCPTYPPKNPTLYFTQCPKSPSHCPRCPTLYFTQCPRCPTEYNRESGKYLSRCPAVGDTLGHCLAALLSVRLPYWAVIGRPVHKRSRLTTCRQKLILPAGSCPRTLATCPPACSQSKFTVKNIGVVFANCAYLYN